ncbi:shikimate kinase [Gorillibacterium sp. sgz500922]|uniref:shikimate kinase n=1 Tax=Gorillibacterium sp. sgz500922 TaxID=3446694 RepID=UPI003F662D94
MTESGGDNIVLVGFMGTGKTTVGRMVADKLGYAFVDSDLEVERAAGTAVAELFAERGEAHFRELESAALARILAGRHQVVATGGGAALSAENRRLMLSRGRVVELAAAEETIVERVRHTGHRPLLAGNVRERVAAVRKEREGLYAFAHYRLETDGLSPQEAAERIGDWYLAGREQ